MIHDPNAPMKAADVSGLEDWIPPDNYFTNLAEHESQAGHNPDAVNPAGDFSPDVQLDPGAGLGVLDINVPIPSY